MGEDRGRVGEGVMVHQVSSLVRLHSGTLRHARRRRTCVGFAREGKVATRFVQKNQDGTARRLTPPPYIHTHLHEHLPDI